MLCLKRCIVPSALQEGLSARVVYHIVLLAYGCPLDLLPVMVYDILSGPRAFMTRFLKVEKLVD